MRAKPTPASGLRRHTDSSQVPGNAKASALVLLASTPTPKKTLSAVRPNGRSVVMGSLLGLLTPYS